MACCEATKDSERQYLHYNKHGPQRYVLDRILRQGHEPRRGDYAWLFRASMTGNTGMCVMSVQI